MILIAALSALPQIQTQSLQVECSTYSLVKYPPICAGKSYISSISQTHNQQWLVGQIEAADEARQECGQGKVARLMNKHH